MTKQIFIIGMPRSGTKLIRGLLNGHPQISILDIETEFLPYWEKNWSVWGGADKLRIYKNFYRFYNKIVRFPYFLYKHSQGELISPEGWYNQCENFKISGVFEALAKYDANADKDIIWGDKSPGYIRHILLIKKHFPEAKIIHIVRDARDYCLSINKAWGKNMLRAAQRWAADVAKAREEGRKFQNDYYEIKYENLLEDPERHLRNICSFLGIEYDKTMLELKKPTENIGDTKGKTIVFKRNTNKYKTMMKHSLRRKIEHIAFPELLESGYESESFQQQRKLTPLENKIYQLSDGLQLLRPRRRQTGRGILKSLNFYLKAFKQSKAKNNL